MYFNTVSSTKIQFVYKYIGMREREIARLLLNCQSYKLTRNICET
jgi:hypothetical protein